MILMSSEHECIHYSCDILVLPLLVEVVSTFFHLGLLSKMLERARESLKQENMRLIRVQSVVFKNGK